MAKLPTRVISVAAAQLKHSFPALNPAFHALEIRQDDCHSLEWLEFKRPDYPLIFTHHFCEARRFELLQTAAAAGVRFIDCDYGWWQSEDRFRINRPEAELILSWHFKGMDEAIQVLPYLSRIEADACPDYIKIAFYTTDVCDTLEFLQALDKLSLNTPCILSVMGPGGEFLRLLHQRFNLVWSYFCLTQPTAPGQISQGIFQEEHYSCDAEAGQVFAVCGSDIARSQSPACHNRFFRRCILPHHFVRMPTSDLKRLLSLLPGWVRGLAVTMPLKIQAGELAGVPQPVNTLSICDNRITGSTNTDVSAVLELLTEAGYSFSDFQRILLLGAGGLAESLARMLSGKNLAFELSNRSPERACRLVNRYSAKYVPWGCAKVSDHCLVLQASACGMKAEDSIPLHLPPGLNQVVVFESVYQLGETALVKEASSLGYCVITGQQMFERQAKLQRKFWGLE